MSDNVFDEGAWHDVRFSLFEASKVYSGQAWHAEVLGIWLSAYPEVVGSLRSAGEPEVALRAMSSEDKWTLYALSRFLELLIAPHQPSAPSPDGEPFPRMLPKSGYQLFVDEVGGWWPDVEGFHPFLHEIVEVVPTDDADDAPRIVKGWWPGFFVGSMLMMRAGVTIAAGRKFVDPQVAAHSTLYWAWRRRYRPVADLSHGWGHNSQWRTDFRRDYWIDDQLCYNVDVRFARRVSKPEISAAEAVELLRFRCSTLTDFGGDEWIWHTHHTEQAPQWLRR